ALNQLDAIDAANIDREILLRHIAEGFFRQVFEHGYFHADLHPGNLFAHADNTATMVDFGITGRLSQRDRITLAEVLRGFLDRDYMTVARAHIHGGWVPLDTSPEKFASAMRAVGEPILGKPLSEISIGRLLGQLFSITETFRMETQTQLLLLQKSLVLVEGLGRTLCPHINMWELVRPVIEEWAKKNLTPPARVKHQVKELLALAPLIPAYLRKMEAEQRRTREEAEQGTPLPQPSPSRRVGQAAFWLFLGAALGCAALGIANF
ncbi:MAG: 2-polyprenylphenol 6-hydroxylase, partial [Alphaproteobacteria bacterium]|nr:2-polyprenylphenol 6-hydroxylase [Alphaproteobacteria bacterium]